MMSSEVLKEWMMAWFRPCFVQHVARNYCLVSIGHSRRSRGIAPDEGTNLARLPTVLDNVGSHSAMGSHKAHITATLPRMDNNATFHRIMMTGQLHCRRIIFVVLIIPK